MTKDEMAQVLNNKKNICFSKNRLRGESQEEPEDIEFWGRLPPPRGCTPAAPACPLEAARHHRCHRRTHGRLHTVTHAGPQRKSTHGATYFLLTP